jgi:hypothetical protein
MIGVQIYNVTTGSPYTGSCISSDTSRNVMYSGIFCKTTDLKLRASINGPTGVITEDSGIFDAEVRVDCMPHIILPTFPLSYLEETYEALLTNNTNLMSPSDFVTTDAVNCPLNIQLLWNGIPYSGTCIKKAPVGNQVLLNGEVCTQDKL